MRLAAVLAALGLVLSCGPSATVKEKVHYLIGVSQANLSEPWRLSVTSDIKDEASRYTSLKVVVTDASDSIQKQEADIDRLLGFGIDILIVSPADPGKLLPAIDRAYRKVPVIVLDRAVEGYNYSLYIGPDNRRIGQEAGRYVTSALYQRGGRVWELLGRKDSPPSLDRSRGFREALAGRPDIVIAKTLEADWLQDRSEDVLAPLFTGGEPVDIVFAQNDAMAYGAALAAQKAHRTDVKFLGIDGFPGDNGGVDLVKRGIFEATFECPTGGKEAVDYGVEILNKVEGIPKKIILRSAIVTPETIVAVKQAENARKPVPRSPDRKPVLGFAQVGSESDWRLANTQSIVEAADRSGIELRFADGQQDQTRQIAAVREFIRQGVDMIDIAPVVASGWDDVLAEAQKAGIPVLVSDRKIETRNPSLFLTYIGSDFEEEGRRAASWLVKSAPRHPWKIVEIRGTPGSSPEIDRAKGFREILEKYPDPHIVASLSADFTYQRGRDVMKGFLASPHPRFDAVFCQNDDMALGAIEALKDNALLPGKDITVVSVDASRRAFESMLRGELSCTIECTPLLGPQIMKIVGDYFKGRTLPYQYISSEEVFPAAVAKEFFSTRKY